MFNPKQTFCENSSHGVSTNFRFINVANVDNDKCIRDVECLSLNCDKGDIAIGWNVTQEINKVGFPKKVKKGEIKIMKALPMNMI